ncbi:hypothetical protein IQ243_28620 [Nostocales cyanobacterium LEGE 11386]|nr:hypothetical protein [Nostocales cyanobacterium LEGE 11386]
MNEELRQLILGVYPTAFDFQCDPEIEQAIICKVPSNTGGWNYLILAKENGGFRATTRCFMSIQNDSQVALKSVIFPG